MEVKTRVLECCLKTYFWKFWKNEKFLAVRAVSALFLAGKYEGRKHRRDFS